MSNIITSVAIGCEGGGGGVKGAISTMHVWSSGGRGGRVPPPWWTCSSSTSHREADKLQVSPDADCKQEVAEEYRYGHTGRPHREKPKASQRCTGCTTLILSFEIT